MNFEIGEIAIFVMPVELQAPLTLNPSWVIPDGAEVMVVEYRANNILALHYGIKWDGDNDIWFVAAHHLKKRRPPKEEGSWEAIQKITGWTPARQGEEA